MKKILVTGGEGFVGSLLCPQLSENNYEVYSYDTGWFRNKYTPRDYVCLTGDIRNTERLKKFFNDLEIDTVINLACISNDPSALLNKELTKSINLDAFEPLVKAAKSAGVKKFIHASTSSVYGVSDAVNITENHALVPLTLYNEYKAMVESLLLKHLDNNFQGVIIRPATICGYAPRLRLDLTVNILTNHAITNREIKVFGGEQQRPNLHIADMCNLYELLVSLPKSKFPNKEIYNVGKSNYKIESIANIVKSVVESKTPKEPKIKITKTETDDRRSYHINSDKIFHDLGFKPQYNLAVAVEDLCDKFKEGAIKDSMENSSYYNVKKLKELEVK
jgi:nucleoside-diphosphate-sugar epimerase